MYSSTASLLTLRPQILVSEFLKKNVVHKDYHHPSPFLQITASDRNASFLDFFVTASGHNAEPLEACPDSPGSVAPLLRGASPRRISSGPTPSHQARSSNFHGWIAALIGRVCLGQLSNQRRNPLPAQLHAIITLVMSGNSM